MTATREKDLVRSVGQRAAHVKRDIDMATLDAKRRINARFDAWERSRSTAVRGEGEQYAIDEAATGGQFDGEDTSDLG